MAKRLLFLLVIALCLISFGMEAKRPEHVSHERHKNRMSNSNRSVQKRLNAGDRFDPTEFQPIRGEWQPGKEKYYYFSSLGQSYDSDEEIVYEYNAEGLLIKQTIVYNRSANQIQYLVNYKYNDDKCLVERYIREPACDYYETFVYDPIITDLVVKSTSIDEYDSGYSSWSAYEKVIERNDVNDIVHYADYYFYNDDDRQERGEVSMTYKNGQVAEILMGDEDRLTDIVWENSNGQIYDIGDTPDDPVECRLYHGDNRLKHASWIRYGELYAVIDVEYKESGFTLQLFYKDLESDIYSYSYGEFGGFDVIKMWTINYEGELYFFSEVWGEEYDRFGIKTLEYSGTYDLETEDITLNNVEYGDVAYNDEYGYPETVTCFRIENRGEPEIQSKTEYSDWINTSLSEVTVIETDEDAPIEYYTLDGLKVKNPTKGLYIRRRGQKTDKIYLTQ